MHSNKKYQISYHFNKTNVIHYKKLTMIYTKRTQIYILTLKI